MIIISHNGSLQMSLTPSAYMTTTELWSSSQVSVLHLTAQTGQEWGGCSENAPTLQRWSVKESGMQIKSGLNPRTEYILLIQILLSKIHSTSYKVITTFTFKTTALHTTISSYFLPKSFFILPPLLPKGAPLQSFKTHYLKFFNHSWQLRHLAI